MAKIQEKLLILRRNNNCSQQYIAQKLGIDVFEYMSFENGNKKIEDDFIQKVVEFYHIEEKVLLDDNCEIEDISDKSFKNHEEEMLTLLNNINQKKKIINLIKKNKIMIVMLGLILIMLITMGINNKEKIEEIINLERNQEEKVYANTYGTIYYQNNVLQTTGYNINNQFNVSEIENVVDIAINDSITALLINDGTVVLSGGDSFLYNIEGWKNIVDIEIGSNHLIGLTNQGKILCTTSSSNKGSCKLEAIENNIKDLFAFDLNSIVVDEDNNIYGSEYLRLDKLPDQKDIKQIIGNKSDIWVLYEDQTIDCLAGDKYLAAKDWEGIKKLVVLDDALFGLTKDNLVVVESKNESYNDIIKWENIEDIAGKSNYLVGYSNNQLIGVGDNQYEQFEKIIEYEQLEKVRNIKVESKKEGLMISFDISEHAEYYSIHLTNHNQFKQDISTNQIIIPLSELENHMGYTVTIQAKSKQEKYLDSKEVSYNFIYTPFVENIIIPTPTASIIPSVIPGVSPKPILCEAENVYDKYLSCETIITKYENADEIFENDDVDMSLCKAWGEQAVIDGTVSYVCALIETNDKTIWGSYGILNK